MSGWNFYDRAIDIALCVGVGVIALAYAVFIVSKFTGWWRH